jgi:tRNA(Ile)-lysidine synthase
MAKTGNNSFQQVREWIQRYALLDKASGVVIAVSGGADSVALLDMLVRLREILAKQTDAKPLQLHVAHLNHLLRGKESDADAEFVLKFCEKLAIGVTIQALDVKAVAKSKGKGIEETARESRYRFFLKVATQAGCDRMATGHTMSDQAETFVMRLARGSGLRGLASMRPITTAHIFNDVESGEPDSRAENTSNGENLESNRAVERGESNKDKGVENPSSRSPDLPISPTPSRPLAASVLLIRPLLCLTREAVEAYCLARGLPFRTDASNESLCYTRNRVRHETMKALRAINPKVVERIAQTAELIASEQDALEHLAGVFLEQAEISSQGWENQNRESRKRKAYSLERLLAQPTGLRRRMIIEAIRREREKAPPKIAQTAEIGFVHIEAIEKLLTESSSGHRVMLPCGLQVWREFDALVLVFSAKKNSPDEEKYLEQSEPQSRRENLYEQMIDQEQASAEVAGFKITMLREQPSSRLQELLEEARIEKARSGVDWKIAALDDSLLPEKLLLRPRRKGQTAWVFGQRKNIKLKKLMIDHKIASSRREGWPIVVTPGGEYVWSPGLPPALKFAATDKTQTLAILRASDV